MAFTRPRPIAVVDVALLGTVNVKANNNVTVNDIYSSIMRNEAKFTSNTRTYLECLSNGINNKDKDNDNSPKTPKHLIKDAVLIGNAVIAAPTAPDFDLFPARLKNYGKKFMGVERAKKPTKFGWYDTPLITRIREGSKTREEVIGYNVKSRQGNQKGKTGAGVFTGNSNEWIPATDGSKSRSSFYELPDGIYINGLILNRIPTIQSAFVLKKNQPFSFKFKLQDLTGGEKKAAAAFAIDFKAEEMSQFLTPTVEIFFGGGKFSITYFKDGRLVLKENGNQVGSEWKIPGKLIGAKGEMQLTVYPLGSYIYVYAGVPTTSATQKNEFRGFNFGRPLQIKASTITLEFFSSGGMFNFSPIIHPKSGTIVSPLIGGGFEPDNKIVRIAYFGKLGS